MGITMPSGKKPIRRRVVLKTAGVSVIGGTTIVGAATARGDGHGNGQGNGRGANTDELIAVNPDELELAPDQTAEFEVEIEGPPFGRTDVEVDGVDAEPAEFRLEGRGAAREVELGPVDEDTTATVEAVLPQGDEQMVEVDIKAVPPVLNEDTGERFDTIGEAIKEAEQGNTLSVAPGNYEESVEIDVEGLTIEAERDNVTLAVGDRTTALEITADNVTIDGNDQALTIEGAVSEVQQSDNVVGVVADEVSDVTVRDLTTTGFEYGVRFDGVEDGRIEGVTAADNLQHGIDIRGGSFGAEENITITESTAIDNGDRGIHFVSFVSGNTVENSHIEGNGFELNFLNDGAGIGMQTDADDNVVTDTTIVNNANGVFIEGFSNNNSIEDSSIADNDVGVSFQDSDNKVRGSNLTNNDLGVEFRDADNEITDTVFQTDEDDVYVIDETLEVTLDTILNDQGNTFDPDGAVAGNLITPAGQAPPVSDFDDLDIAGQGDSATIDEGDDEDVSVEVTNVGDDAGSFDVTLEILEDKGFFREVVEESSRETDELDPDEVETVIFEGVTDELDGAEHDVEISTDAAMIEGDLTVS